MKVSTRNHALIAHLLDSETAFKSHGALFASFDSYPYAGYLPAEWADRLHADARESNGLFVLWSYQTPIAWRLASGEVVVPDVRYSRTTSVHQSHARGWAMRANRVAVSA